MPKSNPNSTLLWKPTLSPEGNTVWEEVQPGRYCIHDVYTRHGVPPHVGYRPISQLVTGVGMPDDSRMRYWVRRRLASLDQAGYRFYTTN